MVRFGGLRSAGLWSAAVQEATLETGSPFSLLLITRKGRNGCAMASDDTILRTEVAPFPPGFCPPTQQAFADAIAESLEVFLPNEFVFAILGPSQPTVEQRGRLWFKQDPSTGLYQGPFTWLTVIGQWGKLHWPTGTVPTDERKLYVGTEASVETFDGGSPGTVSLSTGPFWEVDHDLDDRIPIGADTVPVGTSANTQVGADGAKTEVWGVFMLKPTGRLIDIAV